jgi:hypothetical protein
VAGRLGALPERLEPAGCAILVDGPIEAATALAELARSPALLSRLARAVPSTPGADAWRDAHARLHDACAARASVKDGMEADYAALDAIAKAAPRALSATIDVVRPDPRVTTTWWYPYAEQLKPLAPESLRRIVRQRLSRDGTRVVEELRLPGRRAILEHQLTLETRYLGTTRLVSHGADPRIRLEVDPFDPAEVRLVRFDLWCSSPRSVAAQLYWRHAGQDEFTEERSVSIPLDGRAADWLEYSARLDVGTAAEAWLTGGPIVALRFDPIDVPGPFLVGTLRLCTAP